MPPTLSILSHFTAVAPRLTLGEVYEGLLVHDLLAHWCKGSGLLGEDVVELIKYELLGMAGLRGPMEKGGGFLVKAGVY